MQTLSPLDTRSLYYAAVAVLAAGCVAGCLLLSRPVPEAIQLGDYRAYSCNTPASRVTQRLQVLTLTSLFSRELADGLCSEPRVQALFSGVDVYWRPRGHLTAQHVMEGRYDVFWNRRHLVMGLLPEFYEFYAPLLDTPPSEVYWLSRAGQPRLSRDFFRDKTLGLLADAHSHTYYQQPVNALHRAGIELGDRQKRFYPDTSSLYRAFREGEVDLISSPMISEEQLLEQGVTYLLIDGEVVTGTWFISRRWLQSGVDCALVDALDVFWPLFDGAGTVAPGIDCP
ncbi:hypothetical protein [Haliea sp. E17]|uniref:hypothetical protein n=1 Tax=Haliea sp. E17 TaxID=3401576 RepID=UPI003AB05231